MIDLSTSSSKSRRLIIVKGRKRKDKVLYAHCPFVLGGRNTCFVRAIAHGVVAIDFDARTQNGRGLRNYGAKFRVKYEDFRHLCGYFKRFQPLEAQRRRIGQRLLAKIHPQIRKAIALRVSFPRLARVRGIGYRQGAFTKRRSESAS